VKALSRKEGKVKPKTVLILVLVILALIVVFQNSEMVTMKLLFWKIMMSQILFILGCMLLGFVLGLLVGQVWKRR